MSSSKNYVPERGDLVWIDFAPQAGREQSGRRPAVVLSPKTYNQKSGLALVVPITSQSKGYPFEVALPETLHTQGVVLADHLKSVDWQTRKTALKEKAPASTLQEILGKIGVLLS